jgi:putative hemolysin
MKKTIIATVMIALVLATFLAGCHSKEQKYMLTKEEAQKERAKQQAQVANPATLYCMNTTGAGWQVKEDSERNQEGICTFSDASWCDEWDYYRGNCKPGYNYTSCEGQFWGKMTCPPDYSPVCARVETGNQAPYDMLQETYDNACKACIASTKMKVVVGYTRGACPD